MKGGLVSREESTMDIDGRMRERSGRRGIP